MVVVGSAWGGCGGGGCGCDDELCGKHKGPGPI